MIRKSFFRIGLPVASALLVTWVVWSSFDWTSGEWEGGELIKISDDSSHGTRVTPGEGEGGRHARVSDTWHGKVKFPDGSPAAELNYGFVQSNPYRLIDIGVTSESGDWSVSKSHGEVANIFFVLPCSLRHTPPVSAVDRKDYTLPLVAKSSITLGKHSKGEHWSVDLKPLSQQPGRKNNWMEAVPRTFSTNSESFSRMYLPAGVRYKLVAEGGNFETYSETVTAPFDVVVPTEFFRAVQITCVNSSGLVRSVAARYAVHVLGGQKETYYGELVRGRGVLAARRLLKGGESIRAILVLDDGERIDYSGRLDERLEIKFVSGTGNTATELIAPRADKLRAVFARIGSEWKNVPDFAYEAGPIMYRVRKPSRQIVDVWGFGDASVLAWLVFSDGTVTEYKAPAGVKRIVGARVPSKQSREVDVGKWADNRDGPIFVKFEARVPDSNTWVILDQWKYPSPGIGPLVTRILSQDVAYRLRMRVRRKWVHEEMTAK